MAVSTFDDEYTASLVQAVDVTTQLFFTSHAQDDLIEKENSHILDFADKVKRILKSHWYLLPYLGQADH
jgi:hypothetical protein